MNHTMVEKKVKVCSICSIISVEFAGDLVGVSVTVDCLYCGALLYASCIMSCMSKGNLVQDSKTTFHSHMSSVSRPHTRNKNYKIYNFCSKQKQIESKKTDVKCK